jgi:hypothetical protein
MLAEAAIPAPVWNLHILVNWPALEGKMTVSPGPLAALRCGSCKYVGQSSPGTGGGVPLKVIACGINASPSTSRSVSISASATRICMKRTFDRCCFSIYTPFCCHIYPHLLSRSSLLCLTRPGQRLYSIKDISRYQGGRLASLKLSYRWKIC